MNQRLVFTALFLSTTVGLGGCKFLKKKTPDAAPSVAAAAASAELKQHAQRTAYLQRIRALASKANDAKTVTAVDILITKEDARDADAMNALRSGALPTVAAGATK